ncbi:hypothetical protein D3C71_878810 [compost metagenome]
MQGPDTLAHAQVANGLRGGHPQPGELDQQPLSVGRASAMQGFTTQRERRVGTQQGQCVAIGPLHAAFLVAQHDAKSQAVHELAQAVIPLHRCRELLGKQEGLPHMGCQIGQAIGVLFVEILGVRHGAVQGQAQVHPSAHVLQRADEAAQSQGRQPLLQHGPGFVARLEQHLVARHTVEPAQGAAMVQPRVVIGQALGLVGQPCQSAGISRSPEDVGLALLEAEGLHHSRACPCGCAQPVQRLCPTRWLGCTGIQVQQQLVGFAQVSGRAITHKKSFSTPGALNSHTAPAAPRAGQQPSTVQSVPNAPGLATVDSLVSSH